MTALITQERLREVVSYNEHTGEFTWSSRISAKGIPGKKAGSNRKDGYCLMKICGERFYAHRLAWLYVKAKRELHEGCTL